MLRVVLSFIKDNTRTTKYIIQVSFELGLNYKDKALLENIKYTLGIGNIFYNNDKIYKFKVLNINELFNVIIPHFKKILFNNTKAYRFWIVFKNCYNNKK